MKVLRRSLVILGLLIFAALPTFNSKAASPSVTVTGTDGSGCDTNGAGFGFYYTAQNLAPGSYFSIAFTVPNNPPYTANNVAPIFNGTNIPTGYGNAFPNSTSGIPYSMTWIISFLGPTNQVISRTQFNLTCTSPFSPMTISFVNLGGSGVDDIPFKDSRVNNRDAGQTVAVYCNVPNSGDLRAYAIYQDVGYVAFTVTKAQLAAGNQNPTTAYLIKSGLGAELYRLPGGQLQIRRGTYVFTWNGC